jgi:hypothetical protein
MAHAYTPGLRVTDHAVIRRTRRLPLPGTVLVETGKTLTAETPVARTELPGNVQTVNVASLLGVHQSDIADCMIKKEGDPVEAGEVIASTKSFFGLFRAKCTSPTKGSIESISAITGQVLLREPPIPVEVEAYVDGTVVEVLPREGVVMETSGAFVQGIFGIGGETAGVLHRLAESPKDPLTEAAIGPECKGKVVFGGSQVTGKALEKAVKMGARGVIVGGIDDQDLRAFLGYDLGVAITGSEEKGVTLVITEGFGRMAMARRTFDLLCSHEGRKCSINGATQIRAGVMRPEVVIPILGERVAAPASAVSEGLKIGSPVRGIREPYFGRLGTVSGLPPELQLLETEAKVRVLAVRFDGTEEDAILPRANVEMIEG